MARQDPLHIAATLPCWGSRVSPVPLAGGMTNDNFLVEDCGERFVVRVGGDIPAHNIVRMTEAEASRAAHAAGVSPRVRYADANALVIDFVDGRTLTSEDVRAPENQARLVDLIRRAHREIPKHFPGPAPLFWVFQVVRHYDRVLRDLHSEHVSLLPTFAPMAERLEQAVGPIDIVFGHNDMLAANLLDDGARLWLIDWEYAGFNSPLFDLGGLASNSQASPRGRRAHAGALFRACGRPRPAPSHGGDDSGGAIARNAVEHGFRTDQRHRFRLPRLYLGQSPAVQRRLRRF